MSFSRQNWGSLPSQCSVGKGLASIARWPLCQRSHVMRLHLRRSCRLPGVVRFVFPVAYSRVIPKVPWCKFRRGLCLSFGRPLFDHVRPVSPLACASQGLSSRFSEPVPTCPTSLFPAFEVRSRLLSPSFCLQRKCISHFGRLRNFTADDVQAFVVHFAGFRGRSSDPEEG